MFKKEHEVHKRRRNSNRAIGLVLGGFVAIVFAITIVKLAGGNKLEATDHAVRPSLLNAAE